MDTTHESHHLNPDTPPAVITLGGTLTLINLIASAVLSTEIMVFSTVAIVLLGVSTAITMCQKEFNDDLVFCIAMGAILALATITFYTLGGIWLNALDNVNFHGLMADGSEGLPIWRGD